ncbi:peptidylprolyl isomerase [Billgrantia ethanolica]|uniref:Peptidyl-prolyl cis-trans isomerase n=1 Tax=Billgrantia ethanolica TaxID=2733486 RepID=A0ABS8ZZC1_9GAMM|nr:peptidylprolyl isomerase [Halomonas ethanolica]MCE8001936.1 peptidyl-prolyl cis-trans isomerase [Halomonas ethanolica]
MIILETSFGDIAITLNHEQAPKTAANFEQYVRDGHYDGTLFHRVIPGFMIQGGGFDQNFDQKPTNDPIENEADNGLKNLTGTLAMARTQDPHSATAQFFINVAENDFLNHSGKSLQGWGYCVFGEVAEGMDVVERITAVETTRRGMHADVPAEDVIIVRAYVKDEANAS